MISLLIFSSACATPPPASPPPTREELAADLLSRAIRVRTVNPPGDERPLAELFSSVLAGADIETRVIPTPSGDSAVGRAAVWGVVRGSGPRRPIVLLSHLDVVPADPESWKRDPFAGESDGNFVYGRGALDAKGVSVVHLLTLLALAERTTPPARDVIFLATPDEEAGGADGAGFIAQRHPDLLGGAEFLLTEGGGILIRGRPEPDLWRIGVMEKSPCWLRVVAEGTPGHSSVPPRDAAVPRLVTALARLDKIETPIRVVPEVAQMYRALAPLAAPEDAAGYADLAGHLAGDEAFRQRFMTVRFQAALVTNTFTITVLEGASRTNVVPSRAVAHIDARLLPGESCDAFADDVRDALGDPGLEVETLLNFEANSSPTDTPLYTAIERLAARTAPPAHAVPSVTIGFTDAHYFRDLGIDAYGFTPRAMRREDGQGVHGHDEKSSIPTLVQAVDTLLAILDELDG